MIAAAVETYARVEYWQIALSVLGLLGIGYAAGEARQHWRGPAKTIEELQLARGTIKYQHAEREKLERENAELKDKLRAAAGGAAAVTAAVAGPTDREREVIAKETR